MFVGNVSVNATPVSWSTLPAGFVNVNVSVDVPPTGIVVGLNAFAIVGGAFTCRFAVLLVWPGPPLVDVTAPVVLSYEPGAVLVTLALTVH